MKELYRVLFTRCENSINFYSKLDSSPGQKIFATGGDMGLSGEILSSLIDEIKTANERDVFANGRRSYNGDPCSFFSFNGISVLVYYHFLKTEETGQREFGISYALIGNFDYHPMEYISSGFFNLEGFFFDYPDADGLPIRKYKQLLTFKDSKVPSLFPPISQEKLFGLPNIYPVMSFKYAGNYVLQSKNVAERVRAAVCHLIKQFNLPEEKRLGIAIKGTKEQLRYWFASIEYAFSARAAQKIAFSLAFPPNPNLCSKTFSYNFSFAALVGWDTEDPDLATLTSLPSNLIYLEQLPVADPSPYYTAITKFDDEHRDFIEHFTARCNTVETFPDLYQDYTSYRKYYNELLLFTEGRNNDIDLKSFFARIKRYISAKLFLPEFYAIVLEVSKKVILTSNEDLDILIEIFNNLEYLISENVAIECCSTINELQEEFLQIYIERFKEIFVSILSNRYLFCNDQNSKKPQDFFNKIIKQKQDSAYEIAKFLIQDNVVDGYTFAFQAVSNSSLEKPTIIEIEPWYVEKVVYPRLTFIVYLMKWCEDPKCKKLISRSIIKYIYKAFNSVLVQYLPIDSEGLSNKMQQSDLLSIYKNVFEILSSVSINESIEYDVFKKCLYFPENIKPEYFEEQLQKVFLYNFREKLDVQNKPLTRQLEYAKQLIKDYQGKGFYERVLVSLFLDNIDLDNDHSIFYYQNAFEIFSNQMYSDLNQGILVALLNKVFQSEKYNNDDDNYLEMLITILENLEEYPKLINICCQMIDAHLKKMFKLQNWEECVVNEDKQIYILTDYLSDRDLPISLQIYLYKKLFSCNPKKDNLNRILRELLSHCSVFTDCSKIYKNALLQIMQKKRWAGNFYLNIIKLFLSDEQFLYEILEVMGDTKTNRDEFAFFEFCSNFYNEYREQPQNLKNLPKVLKKYYQTLLYRQTDATARKILNEMNKQAKKSLKIKKIKEWLETPLQSSR